MCLSLRSCGGLCRLRSGTMSTSTIPGLPGSLDGTSVCPSAPFGPNSGSTPRSYLVRGTRDKKERRTQGSRVQKKLFRSGRPESLGRVHYRFARVTPWFALVLRLDLSSSSHTTTGSGPGLSTHRSTFLCVNFNHLCIVDWFCVDTRTSGITVVPNVIVFIPSLHV